MGKCFKSLSKLLFKLQQNNKNPYFLFEYSILSYYFDFRFVGYYKNNILMDENCFKLKIDIKYCILYIFPREIKIFSQIIFAVLM